jgi:hypothetical protein
LNPTYIPNPFHNTKNVNSSGINNSKHRISKESSESKSIPQTTATTTTPKLPTGQQPQKEESQRPIPAVAILKSNSSPAPLLQLQHLQFSASFNSKSSCTSKISILGGGDYSEEFRLLLLSTSRSFETFLSPSSRHIAKNQQQHRRSHTYPLAHYNPVFKRSNNMQDLTPHSNLADLLSAKKKMNQKRSKQKQLQEHEHQKKLNAAAAAAANLGQALPMNRNASFGPTNSALKPISIIHRSRCNTTGTIGSHHGQQQHGIGSDVYPPLQLTGSGPLSQRLQYHQQHQQQQQHQKLPQSQLSLNPFEDPKLMGDLRNQNCGLSVSNYQSNILLRPPLSSAHPLHANSSYDNNNPMAVFDPLQQQEQQQHQQPPKNRPYHAPSASIDTAQLSELAAALSSLKPQQDHPHPEVNKRPSLDHHQVTLGQAPKDSTGTNKTHHRRFLSLRVPTKNSVTNPNNDINNNSHDISKSMNDMKQILDSIVQQESFDIIHGGDSSSFDKKERLNSFDKKERRHKRGGSLGIFKRNENEDGSRPVTPVRKMNLFKRNDNNNEDVDRSRPVTPIQHLRRSKNPSNNGSPRTNTNNKHVSMTAATNESNPNDAGRRKLSLRIGKSHSRNNSVNNGAELASVVFGSGTGISPNHSPSKGKNQHLETIQSNDSDKSKILHLDASIAPDANIETSTRSGLRSSEQDPLPHQVTIPSVSDVLMQAKLCHLMERYREIDQNFDFGVLTNVSRSDMETFIGGRPLSPPRGPESPPSNDKVMIQSMPSISPAPISSLINLVPAHKPIVESVVTCANDLILAGFYYEVNQGENNITHDTTQEKSPFDRTEVAIFASDELRQFIVVYQGSAENQSRPIRNRFGKFKYKATKNFDEDTLTVCPQFEQGYNQCGLEARVFQKLDELAEQHPFFDVIVTGHSYGAMLALLGSTRYASSRPTMMVSCFAFGCPKVGALDFRHYVNSLPNLKVMRVENGFDPWVHAPDNPIWTHAGHTIIIIHSQPARKSLDNLQSNTSKYIVKAFKFGNDRPDSASNGKFIGKKGNRLEKQMDHDMLSYLNVLDTVSKDTFAWPYRFVGEEGIGVQGLNQEKRLVC